MRFLTLIGLAVTLFLLQPSSAIADPITFTHQGVGSGVVGATPFSNASFTITATGDTSTRSLFGNAFFIDHTSATISISGVGTYNFNSGTRTFVNFYVGVVGFSRAGFDGVDLFTGPPNAVFSSWDMLSSIGPISGTASLAWWGAPLSPVMTNSGQLSFSDSSGSATFTATVGNVPEPASLTLLGLGFGAAALGRRLRRPK
jgi:hypothetical protein